MALRFRWLVVAALVLVMAMGLCYIDLLKAAVSANPVPRSAQSVGRGHTLWQQHCQACHGAEGRGDGPASALLRKRPKDLTKIALPPVFPDGVVAYRIANGGEVMPAWAGVLNAEDIWDLVNYIRAQRR
jgi:mono/diheme cytochrome c family protein